MPNSMTPESRYPRLDCHRIPRDENAFVDWLIDAKPGDTLAYYRGHLAFDRNPLQSTLGESRRLKLTHLADRAMETSERKQVLLVQRRMGRDDWIYLAIRTDKELLPSRRQESKPQVRGVCHA